MTSRCSLIAFIRVRCQRRQFVAMCHGAWCSHFGAAVLHGRIWVGQVARAHQAAQFRLPHRSVDFMDFSNSRHRSKLARFPPVLVKCLRSYVPSIWLFVTCVPEQTTARCVRTLSFMRNSRFESAHTLPELVPTSSPWLTVGRLRGILGTRSSITSAQANSGTACSSCAASAAVEVCRCSPMWENIGDQFCELAGADPMTAMLQWRKPGLCRGPEVRLHVERHETPRISDVIAGLIHPWVSLFPDVFRVSSPTPCGMSAGERTRGSGKDRKSALQWSDTVKDRKPCFLRIASGGSVRAPIKWMGDRRGIAFINKPGLSIGRRGSTPRFRSWGGGHQSRPGKA